VPNVIVTHPQAPEDNARLFALLGAIFDRESAAAVLTRELQAALDGARQVTRSLPRERVLYLIWRKPWMTVARDTYVSATLRFVGWDTVPASASRRYPEVADAGAEWRDAERLLLSTEPYAFRARDAVELAQQHARPAHLVDGEHTSWYGSRAIAGMRALAALRVSLAQ